MGGIIGGDTPKFDDSAEKERLAEQEAELKAQKDQQNQDQIARLRSSSSGGGFSGQPGTQSSKQGTLG